MNRGAHWAGNPLPSEAGEVHPIEDLPDAADYSAITGVDDVEERPRPRATASETIIVSLLGLVAFAWIAAAIGIALNAYTTGTLHLADIARGISIASGPLALIVALLILWQRNSTREARRYADAARIVRTESLALDAVLSLVSRRLEEDRMAVANQADGLLMLAEQTSTQLRTVTDQLAREIAELGRQSRDLDAAAGTARVDMGVLLADLPIAEQQTRALADALRGAGTGAHEQAAALQGALEAIAHRATSAEENTAGAANRLSAQVSRIAGASEVATRDIDEAGQRMTGSIDDVLQRAAAAVERTRQGVAAQSEAIDALVDRAQSATEHASAQAINAFETRIAAVALEVEAITARLGEQDGAGAAALVDRIHRGLGAVEARFAELDETGRARTERLGEALGTLGDHAERTMGALNDGGTAATTLINRAETLRAAVRACLDELDEGLPGALAKLESAVARNRETISATGPELDHLNAVANDAAQTLQVARESLEERRVSIEALTGSIAERLSAAMGDAVALDDTVVSADRHATELADSTSPKLVDALIRVRETAGQAAERAREALSSIIPNSAAALGEAGRKALENAVTSEVESQIERLNATARGAVDAARAAAVRLEEQLQRVSTTSASVEDHIAQGKSEVEASDRDNFSRRVSLLIDSLNSTSIDVTKLLSNEASDSAWTAYLRGDRGVFTRRAVRLLEGGEAREITRHYEDEPEFREQVNRYIHDFEALLRPILSTRDGSSLAVILLSSEMGKLYVALAQAIERLRA